MKQAFHYFYPHPQAGAFLRIAWTVLSIFVVESIVFGLAALPVVMFWEWYVGWGFPPHWLRIFILCMSFVPSYVLFAIFLMAFSAVAMRLLGWRTPLGVQTRIEDFEWPLLDWVRYQTSIHVVRIFAGSFFRATPVWTFYLRLNGARLGRGVYINSLAVVDHNCLEFSDGVVIGDGAHVSGHTVEDGMFKTASVRLGRKVTIGLGSVVSIGVEAGDGAQVGALSLVPKFSRLEPGVTYAGIPVQPVETCTGHE